jgi:hypothetical protein
MPTVIPSAVELARHETRNLPTGRQVYLNLVKSKNTRGYVISD